jgi:hypothetical protein
MSLSLPLLYYYYYYNIHISVFITIIISIASETFYKCKVLKVCYCLLDGQMEKQL